ncbi:hypothetical protein Tco_1112847 [Tanacetum coccineum]|uniref:Uncharacterized protein n=1 Tax=Tanacetum coccineum TaxID=301880 RepID=A0ABQ5IQU1_9ASTR
MGICHFGNPIKPYWLKVKYKKSRAVIVGIGEKERLMAKIALGFYLIQETHMLEALSVKKHKRRPRLIQIPSVLWSQPHKVEFKTAINPDSGDSTIDVVEDIPVDVPNILPTHPTLHMDFDFITSHNDLGSDHDVSSPSGDRNKIYNPRICNEVESTRSLATLSPVINTLLPFSSENKDKVFNHGVLASKEKSLPSSSHRGFKASKLFYHKSPMLIHGENIPIMDVPFLHFYPP